MTINQLKAEYKKADARLKKAVAHYKAHLFKVYVPITIGGDKVTRAYYRYVDHMTGAVDYATKYHCVFYRKRGNKFYVKPQTDNSGRRIRDVIDFGYSYMPLDELAGQDFLDLAELELAIESAITARNEVVIKGKKELGVNAYAEDFDLINPA